MSDNIFWPNYLFFTDFSAEAATLSAIAAGPLSATDAASLVAMLSNNDTGSFRAQWTAQPGQPYTLDAAKVISNGPNNTLLPSNALFNRVLLLELPWAGSGPANFIGFHYNV